MNRITDFLFLLLDSKHLMVLFCLTRFFRCKIGHYGLMSNDPLGCKPCLCSLHSSECKLDEEHLSKVAGRPGK